MIQTSLTGAGVGSTFASLPKLVFNPSEFFRGVCAKGDLAPAIVFVVATWLVNGLCSAFFLKAGFGTIFLAPILGLIYAGLLGAAAILAGKWLGGKGGFVEGFTAAAFSSGVAAVTWVPYLGFLFGLYGLVLLLIGFAACFDVDRSKVGAREFYQSLAALWTAGALTSVMAGLLAPGPLTTESLAKRLMVWFLVFACLSALAVLSDSSANSEGTGGDVSE